MPLDGDADARSGRRVLDWNALAAIVASLIGLMALFVSGYTAYVQRQQVRAQVWPYLMIGYADIERARIVFNKGVGPALVRSVQILVDGKPQPDWAHVMSALGVPDKVSLQQSTLANNVLSANEKLDILIVGDEADYKAFREKSVRRASTRVCYCSTLGDCWMYDDQREADEARTQPIDRCPDLPPSQAFLQ
jgi:hypothetical protein